MRIGVGIRSSLKKESQTLTRSKQRLFMDVFQIAFYIGAHAVRQQARQLLLIKGERTPYILDGVAHHRPGDLAICGDNGQHQQEQKDAPQENSSRCQFTARNILLPPRKQKIEFAAQDVSLTNELP